MATTVVVCNIAPGLAPGRVRVGFRDSTAAADVPAEELEGFLAALREEIGDFDLQVAEPETRAAQMRRGTVRGI